MRRPPRFLLKPQALTRHNSLQNLTKNQARSLSTNNHQSSYGFSGAGFLGAYHVGACACLHRHGWLPNPDDSLIGTRNNNIIGSNAQQWPLITGVSAGSMVASAMMAGVDPEPDGMEVALEAARRTRKLVRAAEINEPHSKVKKGEDGNEKDVKRGRKGGIGDLGLSLDVFTPGFSLIDQVEGPFREAMVKALGGTLPPNLNHETITNSNDDEGGDNANIHSLYDIDPELFARRFPKGSLRLGITDRRALWPSVRGSKILDAYRYVDSFRNVEDVIACCMLSSYIPGVTGTLKLNQNVPDFLGGFFNSNSTNSNSLGKGLVLNDTTDRAGRRLREMRRIGLVKHGQTGMPVMDEVGDATQLQDKTITTTENATPYYTDYWDGGLVDVFPTFDANTVIITPMNGLFDPNPVICPLMPSTESELNAVNAIEDDASSQMQQQQQSTTTNSWQSNMLFRNLLQSYLPSTFRHCAKSRLGLNSKNVSTALKMMFSPEDEELYLRFREGYDDTR